MGLLFYLYLCASVVLLGAEVNAVIYRAVPDGMMEAEMPRSLDNETADTQRRTTRDV